MNLVCICTEEQTLDGQHTDAECEEETCAHCGQMVYGNGTCECATTDVDEED